MKTLSVLVINLAPLQYPLLNALAQKGYKLYGNHYNSNNYYNGVHFEKINFCDRRNLQSILDFAKSNKIDAVISDQDDASYFAQAYVAEALRLPGSRIAEAQVATNKWLQRERCKEAGILIPKYILCRNLEETRQACEIIGYPVILKPIDNQGSWGVSKVKNAQEIPEAFYDTIANAHSRAILVEEFIEGEEITVDGYVWADSGPKTLAIATKSHLPNRPVAMQMLYPGKLTPEIYNKAARINEEVIRALGFKIGMTHTEYMVTTKGDIYLIESANRGGGVLTSQVIVPNVSGIDLVTRLIDDCLGINSAVKYIEPQKNQVLLKFFELPPGKIRSIEGEEEIRKHPSVLHCQVNVQIGETVHPIVADSMRHVMFILKEQGDIVRTAEELFAKLHVTYE